MTMGSKKLISLLLRTEQCLQTCRIHVVSCTLLLWIQEAFDLFDLDQNGEISLEELADIMAKHKLHPTRS